MHIELEPIGHVRAPRPHAEDDFWGGEQARIELLPQFAPEALAGLGEFSHIEVLFYSSGRKRPKALSTTPSKGVTFAGSFHQVYPAKMKK